jgi:hypothetical protein
MFLGMKFRFRSPQHMALAWTGILFLAGATGMVGSELEGMKKFENRFEGTAVELHGDQDLTILGIHRVFEQFPQSSNLRVRFYMPKAISHGQECSDFFLEAREIVDAKHYLMRSRPWKWHEAAWNDFLPWPTRDVIDPLGLISDNIGVTAGCRRRGVPSIYFPVDVLTADKPLMPANRYTIYFETALNLRSLTKHVTDAAGNEIRLNSEVDQCAGKGCILYLAATSHAFHLDMTGYAEGVYDVELKGQVPGSAYGTTLRLQIYHHPN